MVSREKLFPGGEKEMFGDDICPHCGARLVSRHDRRQHLSLKVCQNEGENLFDPPWDRREMRDPTIHRMPTPEEIAAFDEKPKRGK